MARLLKIISLLKIVHQAERAHFSVAIILQLQSCVLLEAFCKASDSHITLQCLHVAWPAHTSV